MLNKSWSSTSWIEITVIPNLIIYTVVIIAVGAGKEGRTCMFAMNCGYEIYTYLQLIKEILEKNSFIKLHVTLGDAANVVIVKSYH